ncbi:hypothetical protein [Pedomonas sp. V897]|uniref:hypothetical protein n=1 Tax=Pedomonas sp. V897 TaxID=3446482 RepID=UPI003EE1656A
MTYLVDVYRKQPSGHTSHLGKLEFEVHPSAGDVLAFSSSQVAKVIECRHVVVHPHGGNARAEYVVLVA